MCATCTIEQLETDAQELTEDVRYKDDEEGKLRSRIHSVIDKLNESINILNKRD